MKPRREETPMQAARRVANARARYRERMKSDPQYREHQRTQQAQRRERERTGDMTVTEAIRLLCRLPPPRV